MHSYIITDLEIENAEKEILGSGMFFNDEQKKFLKCLDSCCLQAYAGTGKTSTLIGKLHVLAQKNIWENGRGVCVISHTNVAVDEIKTKVAKRYPAIMQYPNFIGTIQEFTNKFLFAPYLSHKEIQIRFQDKSRFIDYKKEIEDNVIIKRIDNKLSQCRYGSEGAVEKFLKRFKTLHANGDKIFADDKMKGLTEFVDLETKEVSQVIIVRELLKLIQKQHHKGSFLFVESFIYGYLYLKQNPILKNIISQRFQFVFLDEAQDCSEIQINILNELFIDTPNTIFQQIGDINQAISETIWKAADPCLYLKLSMRFGENITNFINKFRVDADFGSSVVGTSKITKKILMIYESNKEKYVLPEFSKILEIEEKILGVDKNYFAISHKHEQIKKYFSDYSENIAKNGNKSVVNQFGADIQYVDLLTEDAILKNGSNLTSNILFNLLYKHHQKNGGSLNELREQLRNGNKAYDFKNLVVEITKDILINKYISNFEKLCNNLNEILGKDTINFISNIQSPVFSPAASISSNNTYKSPNGIEIKVSTIHGVKGQTHDATLLFSNKENSKQDIQHAFCNTKKHTPNYKKLLYVASSRPKYLFAFSIEKIAYEKLTDKSCFKDFEEIKI